MFIIVAAPAASYIPLAGLAGLLAIVSWDMIEKTAIATLLRASSGDAAVLLVTFLLTIFRDLTEAIVIGLVLGSVLFIHRMSQTTSIETDLPFVPEDRADHSNGDRRAYDAAIGSDPDIVVYRITGAFFFGAAASIGAVLDRIGDQPRALVIDFSAVPFLDSTAANTLKGMAEKASRHGVVVILAGTSRRIREDLFANGLRPPLVSFSASTESSVRKARQALAVGS